MFKVVHSLKGLTDQDFPLVVFLNLHERKVIFVGANFYIGKAGQLEILANGSTVPVTTFSPNYWSEVHFVSMHEIERANESEVKK